MPRYEKPNWLKNPDLYAPQVQTGSGVPQFVIPGGKFLTVNPKVKGYNWNTLYRKGGINFFQDTDAPADRQLNWYYNVIMNLAGKPHNNEEGKWGTYDFTKDDIRAIVNTLQITPLSADELAEGYWGMPYYAPQYTYFLQALAEKYADPVRNPTGIPFRHIGTYGSFASAGQWNYWTYFPGTGGSEIAPNNAIYKQYLQSKSRARDLSGFHFGSFAPLGVGTNVKNYIDRPDYCHLYYLKKFEMESICLGYGRVGGAGGESDRGPIAYVDWQNIESLDGNPYSAAWYHARRLESPAGYIVNTTPEHPQVDNDWREGVGFVLGLVLGDGWIQFDIPKRYTNNPATKSNDQTWVPDVSGTPGPTSYPVSSNADYYFDAPFRGQDAGSEAAYYYTQMASTEGRPWRYVPYRFAGSETWINPQTDQGPDNGPTTTILEHAAAFDGPFAQSAGARRGRPDVMARDNGTDVHYYAFDPSLPKGKRETIIVRLTPSKEVSITIQGSVLYPGYDTL